MGHPLPLRPIAAFVLIFGVALSAGASASVESPSLVGPARASDPPDAHRAHANAACEGCHGVIAAEWRGSMHRQAYTDPMFQRALAEADDPAAPERSEGRTDGQLCRTCHAPEADPAALPSAAAAHAGVACVTCHVVEGRVLATGSGAHAPHPVRTEPDLGAARTCGACHEFSLPAEHPRAVEPGVQTTVTEHAASAHADRSCADCHMPVVRGPVGRHRSHRFAASRDPAMLKRAVVASARRTDAQVLELRLAPGEIGHAFPTGEMYRRLLVVAEAVDEHGRVISRRTRQLSRHFEPMPPGSLRHVRQTHDDRIGAVDGDVVVRVDLGALAKRRTIRWRLLYQRAHEPSEDGRVDVAQSTVVVHGEA